MRRSLFILALLVSVGASAIEISLDSLRYAPPEGLDVLILNKVGFAVGFDGSVRVPRWAQYELMKERLNIDVISSQDKNNAKFKFDPDAPLCPQDSDYRGSGKNRGHMVPKADLKWSRIAYGNSFFFTNICPQDHVFNAGAWECLEREVRHFARVYERIVVITGPIIGSNDDKIGSSMVDVPKAFYKVVYAPAQGQMIGFIAPTFASQTAYAPSFACSVREVEEKSGLNFFPSLPSVEQENLETKCDLDAWLWRSGTLKEYKREEEKKAVADIETGFWLIEASGKRHNSNCQMYRFGRGRFCSPNEGKPAGCCGG